MSLTFPAFAHLHDFVGQTPWSAADAPVGLCSVGEADFIDEERVQGDPRGRGVRPTTCSGFPVLGKVSDIGLQPVMQ